LCRPAGNLGCGPIEKILLKNGLGVGPWVGQILIFFLKDKTLLSLKKKKIIKKIKFKLEQARQLKLND